LATATRHKDMAYPNNECRGCSRSKILRNENHLSETVCSRITCLVRTFHHLGNEFENIPGNSVHSNISWNYASLKQAIYWRFTIYVYIFCPDSSTVPHSDARSRNSSSVDLSIGSPANSVKML
jgi:hypothetical protein